jgi:heat shock protein HslJ
MGISDTFVTSGRWLLLILSLAFLVACRPVQTPAQSLPGTSWGLSSLNGLLPLPGTSITLDLGDDGMATGSDGCNRFSIPYSVHGTSIHFGEPAAATMMACPQPVMDQASAYMQALGQASSYTLQSNHFSLLDGRQVLTTFVSATQDLAGTKWQVTAYNNGRQAVVSVSLGSEITAAFDKTGQVAGNAGCNDYFAPYQAAGGAISIGAAGATRKSCASPAGVMEQESAYLAALQSAATYTIEADRLEMRDATGAIAVQLTRLIEIAVATPAPSTPTGRVTAPSGVNVRSGPGTNYPVIGVAPFGAEGEIVGRTADSQWWAVSVPAAPGGIGWVSDDYVAVTGVEDVPVIAVPPPVYVPPAPGPAPTPAPPPTATPIAQLAFWADQTTINQGECTTLHWSVENVQAVWVYPQGQPYQQYPQTGQGSQQVCPPTTTTYEMLVLKRDGTTATLQVTVTVIPAAPQNPLAGTAWQASSYNNGTGAVVSVISGTTVTAAFDQSQIRGNGGCNSYSGPYWVSGSNIAVGPLATNQMMCGEAGVMEQEQQFLAALQSAATYQLDGNRLELRRADGALAVSLVR